MCAHGNAIVSGSPDTIVTGMLAARKGDLVSACPIPEPPGKIVSGSSTVFINSCAAARIGDKVACGAAGARPGGGSVSGVSVYAVKPEDNYVEAVFRDDSFLLQEKPSEQLMVPSSIRKWRGICYCSSEPVSASTWVSCCLLFKRVVGVHPADDLLGVASSEA